MSSRKYVRAQRIKKAAEILAYLNIARVRRYYKAFGEVLGVHPLSVSWFIGEKRKEGSWVVNLKRNQPTRYQPSQKHRALTQRHKIVSSKTNLEQYMRDGWGVSEEGKEEWRGILAREVLACLNGERVFCTCSAFAEVLGVPASSVGNYFGERRKEVSWVVIRGIEGPTELHQAHLLSGSTRAQDIIESGIELETLMRTHWQYSVSGAKSIRDMPISPKFDWWQTENT